MRILHLLVIGVLVFAAAYVYRIKMESTARTERVLRLHAEIREQRDAIAVLRAEWTKLDAPLRLQGLAERHLALKPLNAMQAELAVETLDGCYHLQLRHERLCYRRREPRQSLCGRKR